MLCEFSLAKILNTMPQLLKICPNSNAPTFLCFENFAPTRMPQLGAKKVEKKNTLVETRIWKKNQDSWLFLVEPGLTRIPGFPGWTRIQPPPPGFLVQTRISKKNRIPGFPGWTRIQPLPPGFLVRTRISKKTRIPGFPGWTRIQPLPPGFLVRTRISKKTRIPGCSWLEPGTTRIPASAKKFLVFHPQPGFLVIPGYCDLKRRPTEDTHETRIFSKHV